MLSLGLVSLLGWVSLLGAEPTGPTPEFEEPSTRETMDESTMRVVLLGTGTPNAEPERSGPASAILWGGRAYIVDFGPGVVRRASAAFARGHKALRASNLNVGFLTHLHSDHTTGYADLIFTPWVLGRKVPLRVIGPPGTAAMTGHLEAAYAEDIRIRTEGLERAHPGGHRVEVTEVTAGQVFEDGNLKVTAFPVDHGSWRHALGYRFDTPERSIVISGDTGPSRSLVESARGCDVLVHEVYCQAGFDRQPAKWGRYHKSFHTSTTELAAIAAEVQPKLLVLYHQLRWGCTDEQLVAEIQAHWSGKVLSGNDLDVF